MKVSEKTINQLLINRNLPDTELKSLLESSEFDNLLYSSADTIRKQIYGDEVYIRGLIEFTNYCKNNCYYCGI
ncbi:MAG: [Clostridia bacterium]|nr:[FeFe] hydrogenase H-cluster radical SAM maturase HydE [Clostridia bacterium]